MLRHTFFAAWTSKHLSLLEQFCDRGVHHDVHPTGEAIFWEFKVGEHFYFVQNGTLTYRHPLAGHVGVTRSCWVSMIALWCEWVYEGFLTAAETCELLSFDVEVVLEILRLSPELSNAGSSYARAFVDQACEDVNDYCFELDIPHDQVIFAMPIASRCSFLRMLLATDWKRRFDAKSLKQLSKEIKEGISVVSLTKHGTLLRTLHLYCLEISRTIDGAQLYQIAKAEGGVISPGILKPAWKRRSKTATVQIAVDFFERRVPGLMGSASIIQAHGDNSNGKIGRYGIRAEYLRTFLEVEFEPRDGFNSYLSNSFSSFFVLAQTESNLSRIDVFPGLDPDDPERVIVYAWLQHQDAVWIQSQAADELHKWVQSLDYHKCVAEAALHCGPITEEKYKDIQMMVNKYESRSRRISCDSESCIMIYSRKMV